MRARILPVLLVLAPLLRAEGDAAPSPTPEEVFRMAVERQGRVRRDDILDAHLSFQGQVVEEGDHAIRRDYWYRARDRSFRILTRSQVDAKAGSERGVLGDRTFWDRNGRGEIVRLRPGNREHIAVIRAIRHDREECEQVMKLVLLTRLLGPETRLSFGATSPVTVREDEPYGASTVFPNRDDEYWVLDVEREGDPKLRLFVHTRTHTVHKVVQFGLKRPDLPTWYYFFGAHQRREDALGLTLPRWFSVHDARPIDSKSKRSSNKVRGQIEVVLNGGLKDIDFWPGADASPDAPKDEASGTEESDGR